MIVHRNRLGVSIFFALFLVLGMIPQRGVARQACPAEPNDVPQQAGHISSLPYNTTCSISVEGDVDWFRIAMSAGVGYEFDVSSPTNLDTALELYGPGDSDGDPTGPLVAQGDDEVGLNPQIIHVASASGFYFLKAKISDFAFPPDQTGDYTLDIFNFTPDADDSPTTANQILLPYSNLHEINPDGDEDWFRVSMTNGFSYDFAAGSAASFDSAFWLYGPGTEDGTDTGPLVATDDDSGGDFQPFIFYTSVADGWYYLRVAFSFNTPSAPSATPSTSAKTAADVGPYTLTISSDEPLTVELVSLAATVVEGGALRVSWQTASEVDNAGFEVQLRPVQHGAVAEWEVQDFVPTAFQTGLGGDYVHVTPSVTPGTYEVRLRIVARDGSQEYSPMISVEVGVVEPFHVGTTYPNPVQSIGILPVSVGRTQYVRVDVFDLMGRHVLHIFDRVVNVGVTVPVELPVGGLSSGTYLARVQGDTFATSRLVTVAR